MPAVVFLLLVTSLLRAENTEWAQMNQGQAMCRRTSQAFSLKLSKTKESAPLCTIPMECFYGFGGKPATGLAQCLAKQANGYSCGVSLQDCIDDNLDTLEDTGAMKNALPHADGPSQKTGVHR